MATLSINEMRKILKAYYSPDFAKKVDKMPDNQVFAIYQRWQNRNNNDINKRSKK